jgi:hypothetical protein
MTTNGSQRGSRRPFRHPRPWIRSKPVRTMFRPGEFTDLQQISESWGVPVATAVWAIVHDQLSRWRKRAPELGEHGLAIAAGLAVTRNVTERHRTSSPGGGPDAVHE